MIDKMRIIYTPGDAPIAEYIKTFFDFIGLLVYDELITSTNEPIVRNGGDNSIDVVINMYGLPQYLLPPNQIYLYVNLEKKSFILKDKILNSPKELKYIENKKYVRTLRAKRDTRINILDSLIEKIWGNNHEFLEIIKRIREIYAPTNEDKDMFYILQATNIIDMVFNSRYIRKVANEIKFNMNLEFDYNYFNYIFHNLNDILAQLQQLPASNPYVESSKISAIDTTLSFTESLSFDNFRQKFYEKNYLLYSIKDLKMIKKESLNNLMFKNFAGKFLFKYCDVISLVKDSNCKFLQSFYRLFLYRSILESYLYSLLIENIHHHHNIISLFDKIFKISPYDLAANYMYEYFLWTDGKIKAIDFKCDEMRKNLFCYLETSSFWYPLSFEFYFNRLIYEIQKASIYGNFCREYSAGAANDLAGRSLIEFTEATFINILADENELAAGHFLKYHNCSQALYTLYRIFSLSTNTYRIDPYYNNIVNTKVKELSKKYDNH